MKFTRRNFIKTSAIAASAAAALPLNAFASSQSKDGLPLTVTGYNLDRTRALFDGRVTIDGCAAEFKEEGIGDLNTHVFSGPQTLNVTEVGLHPFMLAWANEGFRAYHLLPIFPLRVFRHKSVFIRTDRGIKSPEDLKGKKVATAGYSSTSLTWIRGIFKDEYGLKPEDMQWIVSQKDSSAKDAGKVSKQENIFPKGVPINYGPEGKDESDLLAEGAVDACFHAAEPKAYVQGHPKVARLFRDYRSVERAFYDKTGIFPIMHIVAIKRDFAKAQPWVVKAVFNAYSEAKNLAYQYLAKAMWFDNMLPWAPQEFEETKALMGPNFYSYGIEPNRKILDTLFQYSYQQNLCKRKLTVEEVFEPSSIQLSESFE